MAMPLTSFTMKEDTVPAHTDIHASDTFNIHLSSNGGISFGSVTAGLPVTISVRPPAPDGSKLHSNVTKYILSCKDFTGDIVINYACAATELRPSAGSPATSKPPDAERGLPAWLQETTLSQHDNAKEQTEKGDIDAAPSTKKVLTDTSVAGGSPFMPSKTQSRLRNRQTTPTTTLPADITPETNTLKSCESINAVVEEASPHKLPLTRRRAGRNSLRDSSPALPSPLLSSPLLSAAIGNPTTTTTATTAIKTATASARHVDLEKAGVLLPAGSEAGCRSIVGFSWFARHVGSGSLASLPRWGHTTCNISQTIRATRTAEAGDAVGQGTAHQRLLVYGGEGEDGPLSDCWCLDLDSARWQQAVSSEDAHARKWHAACYVPSTRTLLTFGGDSDADHQHHQHDHHDSDSAAKGSSNKGLSMLDVDMMLWFDPHCIGKVPPVRSGHSLLLYSAQTATTGSEMLILFGGIRGRSWLHDLYVMSLSSGGNRWVQVRAGGKLPAPRCYHAAVMVGNQMVVFGGNNGEKSFNDVHVLDCSSGFPGALENERWRWDQPIIVGRGPTRRTGSSAVAVADRYVIVTGGWDPDADHSARTSPSSGKPSCTSGLKRKRAGTAATCEAGPLSDAYLLDTETWEWYRIAPDLMQDTTHGPSDVTGRVGHSSTFVEDCSQLVTLPADAALRRDAALPGIILFGGLKGDSAKHGDLGVLLIPDVILAQPTLSVTDASSEDFTFAQAT